MDELSADRLPEIAYWLSDLVESFPRVRYVITSRPTRDQLNLFQPIGFADATLQPMLQTEVRTFIALWHEAAAINRGDGAKADDYDLYRQQLVDVTTDSRELRELATNPLLCALLCALNLRSRIQLPVDKVQFYETAIEMLLERRDAETRDKYLSSATVFCGEIANPSRPGVLAHTK
jgi:predicted NACHT family NTPase